MIGHKIREQLLQAAGKLAVAAEAQAPGAGIGLAIEGLTHLHCAMALGSPQPLAGTFFLPSDDFALIARYNLELEELIALTANKQVGSDDFTDLARALSHQLVMIDAPQAVAARTPETGLRI